jgi:hypothetical protein
MKKDVPKIIKDVGFDFSWDNNKVWGLDIPVTEMAVQDLIWHFDIPFLCDKEGIYNLTPNEVLSNPNVYGSEYKRVVAADMNYPIDIMRNKNRWLILDGLHRLMKASMSGLDNVNVRIVPIERIPEIRVDT